MFALCSSFAAHRATGGEPPQSAQDKARMDKEYLSLMAELGEAPVPSSGGGHSNNHGGGPRSSGQNNNQPPPVSWQHTWFQSPVSPEQCLNLLCLFTAEPASLDELRSVGKQELPQHARRSRGSRRSWRSRRSRRPWWPWRTPTLPSTNAQHGRPPNASKPQRHATPLDAASPASHGPGSRTSHG